MSLRTAVATFRGQRVPAFRIIEHRKRWVVLSGLIIVLSLTGLFVRHLNLSIDFKGGALIEYEDKSGVSADAVRGTMGEFDRGDAEVQVVNGTDVSIRTRSLNTMRDTQREALFDALAKQGGVTADDINVQDVGPTWGSQISRKMVQALVVFLVLVTVYISFRFEWKMAIAAQTTLVHDVLITAGVYALVGREVTPNTVIAILTILGYSLYDTVVIFDKVKENTESTALVAANGYSGVVNMSLNQTLMRSVNTSLVVLLPILSLLLFGGDTLKDFAFALFVGVVSGTYSSIFVAAPLLAFLKEREPRYRLTRAKAGARSARAASKRPASKAEPEPAAVAAVGARASNRPQASRPKKKKKKKPAAKRRRR